MFHAAMKAIIFTERLRSTRLCIFLGLNASLSKNTCLHLPHMWWTNYKCQSASAEARQKRADAFPGVACDGASVRVWSGNPGLCLSFKAVLRLGLEQYTKGNVSESIQYGRDSGSLDKTSSRHFLVSYRHRRIAMFRDVSLYVFQEVTSKK